MDIKKLQLSKGNYRLTIAEAQHIRQAIFERYKELHGSLELEEFNSNINNYDSLLTIMYADIQKKIEECGLEIFEGEDKLSNVKQVLPGKKYLLSLFTNKREIFSARKRNIDISCFFLQGITFIEYKDKCPEYFPYHRPLNSLVINYIDKNYDEAYDIKRKLSDNLGCNVVLNECNTSYKRILKLEELYKKYDECLICILISREFFQNENTLVEYLNFFDSHQELYWRKTIHIQLPYPKNSDEYKLLSVDGHIDLTRFWNAILKKYELQLPLLRCNDASVSNELDTTHIINQIKETQNAIRKLPQFIDSLRSKDTLIKFHEIGLINSFDELKNVLKIPAINEMYHLDSIFPRIIIPTSYEPARPEFPPLPFYSPKFPASLREDRILEGREISFLSESNNPTGTHKDRFAWEVVKYCDNQMRNGVKLPNLSLISSGSSAIAVQNMFNLFRIPTKLKVLLDVKIDPSVEMYLKNIGAIVYKHELEFEYLDSEKIKLYTDNKDGADITYREIIDPVGSHYYDWYSFEILNNGFDYYLIPYGTGELFSNVLTVYKNEYLKSIHSREQDPRLDKDYFFRTNSPKFIGISTMEEKSLMDKLYSSYKPAWSQHRKLLYDLIIKYKCVNSESKIVDHVEESFVKMAIRTAKKINIIAEPSGLAGLAYYLKNQNYLSKNSKVGIVNTGKTRTWEELKLFYDQNSVKIFRD
jgi:hypothetical protein